MQESHEQKMHFLHELHRHQLQGRDRETEHRGKEMALRAEVIEMKGVGVERKVKEGEVKVEGGMGGANGRAENDYKVSAASTGVEPAGE